MAGLVMQQAQFLIDACDLVKLATSRGLLVTAGELYRTAYQQAEYLRLGLSQTLDSRHGDRLAIDINVFQGGALASRDVLARLGADWCSMSPANRWGGNFTKYDGNHFERVKV